MKTIILVSTFLYLPLVLINKQGAIYYPAMLIILLTYVFYYFKKINIADYISILLISSLVILSFTFGVRTNVETTDYLGSLFVLILLFISTRLSMLNQNDIHKLSLLIILSVASVFLLIFLIYGSVRVSKVDLYEEYSLYAISNAGGALFIAFYPIILHRLTCIKESFIFKTLYAFTILCIIFFSESRGVLVISIAITVISFIFILSRKIISKRILLTIGAFIMIIVALSIAGYSYYGEVIQNTMDRVTSSSLINPQTNSYVDVTRKQMSELSWDLLNQHWLTGIGYMSFPMYYENVYGIQKPLHNIYMTFLLEGGITVSILSFILILYSLIKSYKSLSKNRDDYFYFFLFLSLIVILIHSVFRPNLINPSFWIILAITSKTNYRHSK